MNGPGLLVMAAFVGPGTVTTASKAGADYGFVLMWALLASGRYRVVERGLTMLSLPAGVAPRQQVVDRSWGLDNPGDHDDRGGGVFRQ